MKKTDWTDRMLAALVELYPVETTAYTAAVLNLSESTVKLKARELGLVKMAKSRWMERADYIRNHFQECSFSEIGKALGITRMSVGRIAAALGLKRSSEEKHLISSRIRTQMVKRERRRIVFGLEPITGIRVISNRAKVRVRSNMKSNGIHGYPNVPLQPQVCSACLCRYFFAKVSPALQTSNTELKIFLKRG